jgi:asparagine synthase (glutamine-hydrolysing)
MAFSIETRLPFLDYRLVNLITSSDIEQLFNDNWLKGLLRKAMENEMPAEIIFRRNKFGFPAPEKELLGGLTDKVWD